MTEVRMKNLFRMQLHIHPNRMILKQLFLNAKPRKLELGRERIGYITLKTIRSNQKSTFHFSLRYLIYASI